MPRKRTASASVPPQRCFVKELAGETPPSFQAMKRLYGLASDLYGLRPWQLVAEDNLIVVRDSVSGELLLGYGRARRSSFHARLHRRRGTSAVSQDGSGRDRRSRRILRVYALCLCGVRAQG